MHQKLITDLKSLARDILQLEEGHEINSLHKKIQEIHERIIVLEYLNNNADSSSSNQVVNEPSFEVDTTKIAFEEKMKKELETNSIKLQEQKITNAHDRIEKNLLILKICLYLLLI